MNDSQKALHDFMESMDASQLAINTQVASEYSFNELMKELNNA